MAQRSAAKRSSMKTGDNEWGYSLRVADVVTYVAERERQG
jgi:glyceraldehyde-3-phosphate dehydrogenase/erythrose-4-phosphate dehydrogenase